MQVRSLAREDPLEEGTEIQSSILVWRIPWTEEPGGLRHDRKSAHTRVHLWQFFSPPPGGARGLLQSFTPSRTCEQFCSNGIAAQLLNLTLATLSIRTSPVAS